MNVITDLPIEKQIEIQEMWIKNSEEHIKHYSSNPIQLDELRFKIQTQGLEKHNRKLVKQLDVLKKSLK